MNDNKCSTCLFVQVCTSRRGCDNYTPAGDDAEYEALDTYIEERRIEFHEEWRAYVPEEFE